MDNLSNTPKQNINKRDPQHDDKKGDSPVQKVVNDTKDDVHIALISRTKVEKILNSKK
jgi:hypothetical protein